MSSTSRGSVREPSDYYVTPIPAIEHFLREWAKDEPYLKEVKRIFDPCAGGTLVEGRLTVPMSYPMSIRIQIGLFPSLCESVETMDIRSDSPADIIRNYMHSEPAQPPDLIITNPPFAIAQEITKRALCHVKVGGEW